ncbi:TIGR03621 family F420-dependent LLM class oxidoreductase [Sciscionella marina]|uniref:TIGR03621 family F420-dependent LLM class oxidoreductase n=1 Tax=Sciscionella marina TaxID=508770 RepID=UPI0003669921|nr:TIGR03621 family F420-dependent LLM class oxidoreductase [Sciscionella marina]
MAVRDFRFGVNMLKPGPRAEWVRRCRAVEDLGFDVLAVPDHLGMPAPFPAVVLAAESTERVRLTTLTLNTAFYNPTLLARDVVGTDQYTDGRFELGLGAGYAQAEFDKAGIPFERAGLRIDHLERTLDELARYYADEAEPDPVQRPGPPVLIGGDGNRVLRLAAERADIVAFSGAYLDGGLRPRDAAGFAERVRHVEAALNGRDIERNLLVQQVMLTEDSASAYAELAVQFGNVVSAELLAETPILLVGTAREIAEKLLEYREEYGITYVTVIERGMADLAKVIPYLR